MRSICPTCLCTTRLLPETTSALVGGTHSQNSQSRIWAANTPISASNFSHLFAQLKKKGVTRLKLYSGARGVQTKYKVGYTRPPARHPTARCKSTITMASARSRRKRLRDYYAKDRSDESEFASLAGRPGHTIGVIDLAALSDAHFVHITDSNAIIVHAYCYGLADPRFMRRHNIRKVTTYRV